MDHQRGKRQVSEVTTTPVAIKHTLVNFRYLQFHCTDSGRRLGGYLCGSYCVSLAYDVRAKYVFVGDFSGQITVCKLDAQGGVTFVNSLKGHKGSVQSLCWDGELGWLFSGSYDASVFVWDIAGRKGTVYELHGHRHKVTAVKYIAARNRLLSASEDSHLVSWDLSVRRDESSDWAESDTCQLCSRPFFWNFRAMYDQKQFGITRQHHCRRCGRAVCAGCSNKNSPLPLKGHEFPVRVCEDCYIKIEDRERKSQAEFFDIKHVIKNFDLDLENKLMLTVGQDRLVKLWKVPDIV